MQTRTQFNHSNKDVFSAMGVDKERLNYLIDRLNQIRFVTSRKSEVIEQAIKLCDDPAELWVIAFAMGKQNAWDGCPLKQFEKLLKS